MKVGDIVKISGSTTSGTIKEIMPDGRVCVEHDDMQFIYSRSLIVVQDHVEALAAMSYMGGYGAKHVDVSRKKSEKQGVGKVYDLHQEKLPGHIRGMRFESVCDAQVAYFLEVLREHEGKHGAKLIFLHGGGEGILRTRLKAELNKKKSLYRYAEANYLHYDAHTALQVTVV